MGSVYIPVADSFWCLAKLIQCFRFKNKIKLKKNKIKINKNTQYNFWTNWASLNLMMVITFLDTTLVCDSSCSVEIQALILLEKTIPPIIGYYSILLVCFSHAMANRLSKYPQWWSHAKSCEFGPLSAWMFGEGNGTPLQYSCLENPMDGGAWFCSP